MPNFKTHFGFGTFLAIIVVAVAVSYSIIIEDAVLAVLFIGILIGTILPDLDSDNGMPFKIAINLFSVLIAGAVFSSVRSSGNLDIKILAFAPIGAYFLVRIGIGEILKKFTNHRGIIHSIPMAVIIFFLSLMLIKGSDFSSEEKIMIAFSVGFGFLGHLFLDELNSLLGILNIKKKSERMIGGAMKLWSRSKIATVAVYFIIGFFIYLNQQEMPEIISEIKKII